MKHDGFILIFKHILFNMILHDVIPYNKYRYIKKNPEVIVYLFF